GPAEPFGQFGGIANRLAAADLDGDGRLDLVTTANLTTVNSSSGTIHAFRNRTGGVAGVGPPPGGGSSPHAALAISRLAPNPSAGRFAATLTAARAGAGRLALYAPNGRLAWSRGPVALVAGANTLTLDAGAADLPAGVYWMRASMGEASAVAKVVLLGR